jgi:GntR family transcriptional regulator
VSHLSGGLTTARPILSSSPRERGSGIALCRQIQHKLMDPIRSGAFKPIDPLPSVEEIANRFVVSLMTPRQAVRSPCDPGLIYSQQRRGTFISRTQVERNARPVLSFTEEMQLHGSSSRSRVLSPRLGAVSREVRKAPERNAGDKVCRLHRLRIADGATMGAESGWLPALNFPATSSPTPRSTEPWPSATAFSCTAPTK